MSSVLPRFVAVLQGAIGGGAVIGPAAKQLATNYYMGNDAFLAAPVIGVVSSIGIGAATLALSAGVLAATQTSSVSKRLGGLTSIAVLSTGSMAITSIISSLV